MLHVMLPLLPCAREQDVCVCCVLPSTNQGGVSYQREAFPRFSFADTEQAAVTWGSCRADSSTAGMRAGAVQTIYYPAARMLQEGP